MALLLQRLSNQIKEFSQLAGTFVPFQHNLFALRACRSRSSIFSSDGLRQHYPPV